jgi:hypothetical protein
MAQPIEDEFMDERQIISQVGERDRLRSPSPVKWDPSTLTIIGAETASSTERPSFSNCDQTLSVS